MGRLKRDRVAWVGGTFLFFLGLYGITTSGRFHIIDEYETFFIAQSLLERGESSIPQAEGSAYFFGKRGLDRKLYAPYGLGQPLLTLPFLWLGKRLAPSLGDAPGEPDFWPRFWSSFSGAFYSALGVALFQIWLLQRGIEIHRAAWGAVGLGAGTLIWAYATQYRSSTLVMALLLAIVVASEWRREWAGALLLGPLAFLALLVRSDALVGIGVIALYRAWERLDERNWAAAFRQILPLALGSAAALAFGAALNYLHFGNPFESGYPGQDDCGRPANAFGFPRVEAALALLISPGKGLLFLSPLLLLAAVSLPALVRRKKREAVLVLGMSLSHVIFFSAWQHYEGGWCFGPRFLLPIVPILFLPLVFSRCSKIFTLPALVWGVSVNVLAFSVNFLAVARAGDYYQNLEDPILPLGYNFWHNPLPVHAARLVQGLASLGEPRWVEENFGSGLDFWWVYAAKAGIPLTASLLLALSCLAMLAVGCILWWRAATVAPSKPLDPPAPSGVGCKT